MMLLGELRNYALDNGIAIIQDETLDFLKTFIKDNKITSILEIGTAIGYSALQMAEVPFVKRIVSLERDCGLAQIAQDNVKRAGKSEIIEIVNKDALSFQVYEQFDLLFIDGAKAQYQRFFDAFIANVTFVIVDNMDFHGMVENPALAANRNTRQLVRKVAKFKNAVTNNKNYRSQYYKKGDGILVISKTQGGLFNV